MKKEKRVKYESTKSICSVCDVQIGQGNLFEWYGTSGDSWLMAHPECAKGVNFAKWYNTNEPKEEANSVKVQCHVCDSAGIKVNEAGKWVCMVHAIENNSKPADINLADLAKELKKYITLEDLDKVAETAKKLNEIKVDKIVDEMVRKKGEIEGSLSEFNTSIATIEKLLEEQRKKAIPKVIHVKVVDKEVDITGKHKNYPYLLKYMANKVDTWVNGPAGSGKTTAIKQAAEELEMPFYALQLSQLSLKSELTGYRDIMDKSGIMTPFWEAYKNGGVFFGSEFDNWAPSVITSVNVALANGYYPFPTETIERHKDFVMVVDGNTIGLGADSHYVTSRAISAASRDRFRFLEWPIDEDLEFLMVPEKYKFWVEFVQKCRAACRENGDAILITPRATMQGAQDLEMGFTRKQVVANVLLRNVECPSYLLELVKDFGKEK